MHERRRVTACQYAHRSLTVDLHAPGAATYTLIDQRHLLAIERKIVLLIAVGKVPGQHARQRTGKWRTRCDDRRETYTGR